ncbi:hypothetical protein SERLADRAFT_479745 [Serpula lacrymans var. lacrymans S7.9]|nr:uncharacterized protein SERLADRAFT_479745 [Serpula lacrymans var. lacrymans S7.9]EGO19318.1 hypothetical protein SERLADRAFT_479745 [Serpula lacrymans var. lacrymans S7.9]
MFGALRATRTIANKSISYAVWYPDIARAHVTVARGIHFTAMGHSVARQNAAEDGSSKLQKRLELLPEEALYLVERGAMLCFKQTQADITGMDDIEGAPMSVQQAFAEMIGQEDLSLEKYQVFAYFRRLGYVVTRSEPPTSAYPAPPPLQVQKAVSPSVFQRLYSLFPLFISRFSRIWRRSFDWWRPLGLGRWIYYDMKYATIFRSLRFIPSGHSVPPKSTEPRPVTKSSPYKIFYNIYKPSTSFRKTAPPPPDFFVVVVDARSTVMPSLHELTALFDVLPETPPPLPRQRGVPSAKPPNINAPASNSPLAPTLQPPSLSLRRMFRWMLPSTPAPPSVSTQQQKPNPFAALKAGKRSAVIAAVDAGNISFFRFSQGAFEEWPMI